MAPAGGSQGFHGIVSRLWDGAVDLPCGPGDVRLETEMPHDLFQGSIVSPCAYGLCRDHYLSGVWDVLAVDPPEPESGLGQGVEQEGPAVGLRPLAHARPTLRLGADRHPSVHVDWRCP